MQMAKCGLEIVAGLSATVGQNRPLPYPPTAVQMFGMALCEEAMRQQHPQTAKLRGKLKPAAKASANTWLS